MSKFGALKLAVDQAEPEQEDTREVVPPPTAPLDVVRHLLKDRTVNGHLLLRKYRGDYFSYVGPQYALQDPEVLRKWFYERLERTVYLKVDAASKQMERVAWQPDRAKVDRLVDALVAPTLIDATLNAPVWLSTGQPAAGFVPCLNGLVDVNTQQVMPSTPDYFGLTCIPVEYDQNAPEPVEWMKFLRTLWPPVPYVEADRDRFTWWQATDGTWWRDREEIRTLRLWMAYVLSGRLDLQKMLLLIGPPRSGKGTVGRILTALVGEANCSAPTLAGISTNFGLESSIGKSLMVVGDARLSTQGQETVIERLLSISGQDAITLDRKNRTAWTGTMSARVMVLSNDTPKFVDASGAIASRFVILRMEQSFLGREDTELERRIRGELQGVLRWALDGVSDLRAAGRIVEPPTHHEAMQEMYDLVSPISAFLRDVCDLTPAKPGNPMPMALFADVYAQYEVWCRENTRGVASTALFSANLRASAPHLKTDYRPWTAPDKDGKTRRLPRHIVGLKISAEWTDRVKPSPYRTY